MLQAMAELALASFETATRPNGLHFVRIRDGSPEWIRDMIRDAGHDDASILPDDYRYQYVMEALECLAEGTDPDDVPDACRENVDVYTHDLLAWLSESPDAFLYVDAAIREGAKSLFSALTCSQGEERAAVAYQVVEWLRDEKADK